MRKNKKRLRKIKKFSKPLKKLFKLKKRTRLRLQQGTLIVVATVCTASLALAVAKPVTVKVEVGSPTGPPPATVPVEAPKTPPEQVGTASWYALGLPYPDRYTCASTKYPRGTWLEVTNKRNGKRINCLVNDYGPAIYTKRVIDLSRGSFRAIEDLSRGLIQVEVRVAPPPPAPPGPSGINIDVPQAVSQILGYTLCRTKHTERFCDTYRQKQVQL